MLDQVPRAFADLVELLALLPERPRLGQLCGHQVAHFTDADHEELVLVVRADAEELHPLEQRHVRVFRFTEDPAVEFEPAELAVEQRQPVVDRRRRSDDCRRSFRKHGRGDRKFLGNGHRPGMVSRLGRSDVQTV